MAIPANSLDAAKNFAKATVSAGFTSGATTITVSSGHGARLPAAPFTATWWNATDYSDPSDDPQVEIVRVTNVASDTLTVTRAQEGTAAGAKNAAGKTYKLIVGLTAKHISTDLPALFNKASVYDSRLFRLADFSRVKFVGALSGPADGISGVTYSPITNTVFAIRNQSGAAAATYEYDLEGNLLRTITHSNFTDTEGICWMSGDTFAICEENPENRITVVTIAAGQTTLNRNNHLSTSFATGLAYGNLGIEGAAYCPDRNLLYFTTEKSSAGTPNTGTWPVYSMDPATGAMVPLFDLVPIIGVPAIATDIADIYFDALSQHFFLLSEESDKVIELAYDGTFIGQLALTGLNQPEGLCFTPNMETMFVSGEVRELARYERNRTPRINRQEQVIGSGTAYTLTNATARIDFGTIDAQVSLPSAGTYLLIANINWQGDAAGAGDDLRFKFRNSTDSADVGTERQVTCAANSAKGLTTLVEPVVITATKTIQLFGHNATSARGTVLSAQTTIQYVQLL